MKIRSRKASALLIVLAFIVIIAAVLLAYMARTQQAMRAGDASASMIQTDLLAQTAQDAIIDDLRQEMLAGADGSTLPATNQPMKISQPWAMVPGRVLSDSIKTNADFVNLIKQSLRGKPFYPGDNPAKYTEKTGSVARSRASAVNSSTPAKNGRYISLDRWNKPALLGGSGFTQTNDLPDWILVTRAGVSTNGSVIKYQQKNPANMDFVIGRYAYNIYDVGGLLDINVAGFDDSNSTNKLDAARKGSMAWADLSAIPGILDVKSLVAWRNKEAIKSGYLTMIREWGEPRGFQKPYQATNASDNRFFTRQDLLDYQATHGSAVLEKTALPLLTTFSADLDQPSFAPDPSRDKISRSSAQGGNDAQGKDNPSDPSSNNPNALAVTTSQGKPVVSRRFPLDRLKYVVPNPSQTDQQDKITPYFGLKWNTSTKAWDYVDGTSIKPLAQVTGNPNFFEILKAAITAGSLGEQFQIKEDPSGSPRKFGRRDGMTDFQIFQIGANIIDQYDSDSYPTRITYATPYTDYVVGSENLPYIYMIRNAPYRIPGALSKDDVKPAYVAMAPFDMSKYTIYRSTILIQPTLWNPYAPDTSGSTDKPTQFRITASTGPTSSVVQLQGLAPWWQSGYAWTYPSISGDPRDDNTDGIHFDPATTFLTFNTTGTGKASFREPYTLKAPNYPPGSAAAGYVTIQTLDAAEFNDPSQPDESSNQAIGFQAGWTWGLYPADKKTSSNSLERCTVVSDGITYELQYSGPDGWVTYDKAYSVPSAGGSYHATATMQNERPYYFLRMDPRTERFGYFPGLNYRVKPSLPFYWAQGQTSRPGPAAANRGASLNPLNPTGANWTIGSDGNFEPIAENKGTGGYTYYKDPDGVLRYAMGGYSNGVDGLPLVTNNTDSRPIILNRPFRSVAELGYAFRGTPWKQIDFSTPKSGDAALLDYFCIYEPADAKAEPVVAGRFNLNTRHPEVLEAMLRGVTKTETEPLSQADAKAVANALQQWTQSTDSRKGPLRNRAELVGKFIASDDYSGFSSKLQDLLAVHDAAIQIRREGVMRALVDAGSTRTWTFLIDLIVQTGRYSEQATGLDQFLVKGERRYWIHLSIDRFTGKVVAKQVEVVSE